MKETDIITVTLNPAIDSTLSLSQLNVDRVNIVQNEILNPAGKGVNVSYYLSLQGYKSNALGFLGSENDKIFKDFFQQNNIDENFILVNGKTRTNIKIIDNKNHQVTDVNMQGFLVTAQNKQDFKEKLSQVTNKNSIVVLAGSLPPSVEDNFYSDILPRLTNHKVILDTSGNALKDVLNSTDLKSTDLPYAIKPNEHELAEVLECDVNDFNNEDNLLKAIAELKNKRISLVVVSLGEKGMIFSHGSNTYRVKPAMQKVASTVGAGDALVCGLALSLENNLSDEQTILLATSLSMGAVTVLGIGLPSKEILESFKSQISITKL